jgi:hypothetical protein
MFTHLPTVKLNCLQCPVASPEAEESAHSLIMPEIPRDFHPQCTDRTAPAFCGVPSARCYFNPETYALMEKHLGGEDGVPL